jgi:hypothetical protein
VEENLDWIEGAEGDLRPPVDIHNTVDIHKDTEIEQYKSQVDLGPTGIAENNNIIKQYGFVVNGTASNISNQTEQEKLDMMRTIHTHGRKRKFDIAWPSASDKAVSEYSDTKIFSASFPWLFPGGIGDISDTPKKFENDWGPRMLQYTDARFLCDPVFVFYANNYVTRRQNSSTGKWFVDTFYNNAPETLAELKESIRNGNMSFVNSLTYSCKRVMGSPQYWTMKRRELYAWVNHHVEAGNGAPSFFITLSCAEHHWPDIIRLIKERMDIAGISSDVCYLGSPKLPRLLNDYSIVVQEYFQKRVLVWFNTIGKFVFGINHHWIRYEFAPGRGQIHAHVLCISNDRMLRRLTSIYSIDQEKMTKLGNYMRDEFGFDANLNESNTASCTSDSPMSVRFTSIPKKKRETDANLLLQKCQIHNCSGFCIKKGVCKVGCGREATSSKADTPGFPLRDIDSVEKDHRGITKIYLKRNHTRVNQTSKYALSSWRGNCDVQVMLYGCKEGEFNIAEIANVVDYVVAYSCKGNATLQEELQQNKSLVMFSQEMTGCQRDVRRICRQVLNKTATSRLISKQEATVMLSGLPLTDSTETVESVSISLSQRLNDAAKSNNQSTQILPQYRNRLTAVPSQSLGYDFLRLLSLYDFFILIKNVLPPTKQNKNIYHFEKMHKQYGGDKNLLQYFTSLKYKAHPKSSKYIIPNFVGIQSTPCFPVSEQYARATLTIYQPWVTPPTPDKSNIRSFHIFVNSKYCPTSVKLAYMRVVQRHINKTTFIEPKQGNHDHSNNIVSEEDQEMIDLMGLQPETHVDHSDEYNIKDLPKGPDFIWNKKEKVRGTINCYHIDFSKYHRILD